MTRMCDDGAGDDGTDGRGAGESGAGESGASRPGASRPRAPSLRNMIVCISDFQDGWPPADGPGDAAALEALWRSGRRGPPPGPGPATGPENLAPQGLAPQGLAPQGLVPQALAPHALAPQVLGSYLERLPLAAVAAGIVGGAEIWHHWRPGSPPPFRRDSPHLARRAFALDPGPAPFSSADMLAFVRAFGPPALLCVWGLGVAEDLLVACEASIRIYNSIDAPALRIPWEVSRHFDLVLTGANWQSREVRARHPGMATLVLPIGPEFAAPEQFRPLGVAPGQARPQERAPDPFPPQARAYDLIYVAAAQPYKRHDILFDAMEHLRDLRALCVIGYGEMGEDLRAEAARRALPIDFIGPPGVPFAEVNRLMNSARIGLVCGEADGAPAILTEYMLAGLPVLANAGLACGLQYIRPETGRVAAPVDFPRVVREMLADLSRFTPRDRVLDHWSWPRSVARLDAALAPLRAAKCAAVGTN